MDFTQLKNKIKGPIYSIITPFTEKEEIDYESLSNYIDYLYNGGARIFYSMAFNTRYLLMSNQEIMDINQFVIKKVKSLDENNIVIVGDPLNCSTKTSIQFAKHAKENGADVISLIYRAYFVEGRNISDMNELLKIAETAGFDRTSAKEILEERSFKLIVDEDWKKSRELGITGVPTFQNKQHLLVGCQPYEILEHFVHTPTK